MIDDKYEKYRIKLERNIFVGVSALFLFAMVGMAMNIYMIDTNYGSFLRRTIPIPNYRLVCKHLIENRIQRLLFVGNGKGLHETYVSTLTYLRNDYYSGALQKNDYDDVCIGRHQWDEKCKYQIDYSVKVCDESIKIDFWVDEKYTFDTGSVDYYDAIIWSDDVDKIKSKVEKGLHPIIKNGNLDISEHVKNDIYFIVPFSNSSDISIPLNRSHIYKNNITVHELLLKIEPTQSPRTPIIPTETKYDDTKGYFWKRQVERCKEYPMFCTKQNYTVERSLVTHEEACTNFKKSGIKRMILIGDSFSRHMHIAFLQWIRNDYRTGALPQTYKSECVGEELWNESNLNCRHSYEYNTRICNDTIQYDSIDSAHVPVTMEMLNSYDVIISVQGCHRTYPHPPLTIEALINGVFPNHVCISDKFKELAKQKLFIVHPHYRQYYWNREQSNEFSDVFASKTTEVLMQDCGLTKANFIDGPIRLTATLMHLREKHDLASDMTHWMRLVNLLKVQETYKSIIELKQLKT